MKSKVVFILLIYTTVTEYFKVINLTLAFVSLWWLMF